MRRFGRISLAAAAAGACSTAATERLAVCPLPPSSLSASAPEASSPGTRSVVWNYLGAVPLAPGWSVTGSEGTRLELADAKTGSILSFNLACCGAIPPVEGGARETVAASGRRFDVATSRSGASQRLTFRTFPFASVALEGGRAPAGQIVRVPAVLTAVLSCSGSACAEGRAMVLGISYDANATRMAVEGIAGPGTSGAPLRTDGVPHGIELPAPQAGMPAPRPGPDVYTPEACAGR